MPELIMTIGPLPPGFAHRVRLLALTACLAVVAASGGPSARQAATEVVLHVNQRAPGAGDQGPGTVISPFLTIQAASRRAMQVRAQGQSVTVAIHGGVYRETVSISEATLRPDAPLLVFEGVDPDVVVAGSDVVAPLAPETATVRSAVWPYRFGLAPIPSGWEYVTGDLLANPVVRRAEIVFIGGRLLTQVLSATEVRAMPGRFWVDESPTTSAPGTLWWRPHADQELGALVEVATRPLLFSANRVGNLVIRGITFRHAATPLQDGAVRVSGCANVLLENVKIIWNNWNGVSLYESRNVTLRRVVANHNGAGGINGWRVRQLIVEDVEASYNNWRGGWGGFTGWATGQKFFSLHGARFTRFRAVGNQTTGLWLDTDHEDILVEQSGLCDNLTRGLFLESVQGPLTVRDSVICNNGEIGVFATAAAGITFERTVVSGNRDHQVFIPWLASQHVLALERNYETGQTMAIRSERWTLTDNLVMGDGRSLLFSVGQWPEFLATVRSERNQWVHGARRDVFATYRNLQSPASRVDLEGWRALSRQDRSSSFSLGTLPK